MPELPEVETTRRQIAPILEGALINTARVEHPRMLRRQPEPGEFSSRLEGRRVGAVGRRGKFLMIELAGGLTWIIHLGMSGRVQLAQRSTPPERHTHMWVATGGEVEIRLVDPRTFGFTAVLDRDELASDPISLLGPDALAELPRAGWFEKRLERRGAPIKNVLLDQRFLAGLGNIYADEVIHRAAIDPRIPGRNLSHDQVVKLRGSIRPVLQSGLRHGGTTLDDLAYLLPDGRTGRFVSKLQVYGRAGEPCRRCSFPLKRVVLSGRSSFFCPNCQH